MTHDLTLVIDNAQTADIQKRALTWPEKARALAVTTADRYEEASAMLLGIKGLRREIDGCFDPIIADAHRTHRTACEQKRQAEAPLVEAEGVLKGGMSAFHAEQERLRREEQIRLEREAREREEQRRIEDAAALEREAQASGDTALLQEAERLLEEPLAPAPITVASTTPKVSGIVHREQWSARLISKRALIRFVAQHPEYENLLDLNQSAANQLARSLRKNLRVDGLQAITTSTVAAGGR